MKINQCKSCSDPAVTFGGLCVVCFEEAEEHGPDCHCRGLCRHLREAEAATVNHVLEVVYGG